MEKFIGMSKSFESNSIAVENFEKKEVVPSLFKRKIDSIWEKITSPQGFESPELYEKLGIRIFKKYMPTSGDLVSKYVWKKLGAPDAVTLDPDSVEVLLRGTKSAELIHYAGFAAFSALMYESYIGGGLSSLAFTSALNVLMNAYPIMLQRYNRIRLTELKEKMDNRNVSKEK